MGLGAWRLYDEDHAKGVKITVDEAIKLRAGYEEAKANFRKRLDTYLKKYGLTCVESYTYWRDE